MLNIFSEKKQNESYKKQRSLKIAKLKSIIDSVLYSFLPYNSKTIEFSQTPLANPHIFSSTLCTGSFSPTLPILPKLEIDLCEILNALNDDQTNVLSAFDPTTQIEAAALFYKGHVIQSQLESVYMKTICRIGNLYGLFEHNSSHKERGVVEVVQIRYCPPLTTSHVQLDDHQQYETRMLNGKPQIPKFFKNLKSFKISCVFV